VPFHLDFPNIDDTTALADWIEVALVRNNTKQLSRAKVADAFAATLGASVQEVDLQLNWLFNEIRRRQRVVGDAYPLRVEESVIKLDITPPSAFYIFFLLLSLDGPMRKTKKFAAVEQIFDETVREAVRRYLGPGTEAIRFGWPPSNGRPGNFLKAIDWLAEQIGIPVGPGRPPKGMKDGGVDVVAWKPFKDNRSAFVLTLVQCTVQLDWHPKSKDILDQVWSGRLDSGRTALLSIAVPFVIPRNYQKWDDLRRMTNVVFDRLRLSQVLSGSDTTSFKKMISWIETELDSLSIDCA